MHQGWDWMGNWLQLVGRIIIYLSLHPVPRACSSFLLKKKKKLSYFIIFTVLSYHHSLFLKLFHYSRNTATVKPLQAPSCWAPVPSCFHEFSYSYLVSLGLMLHFALPDWLYFILHHVDLTHAGVHMSELPLSWLTDITLHVYGSSCLCTHWLMGRLFWSV